jgi:hypothetical protein
MWVVLPEVAAKDADAGELAAYEIVAMRITDERDQQECFQLSRFLCSACAVPG